MEITTESIYWITRTDSAIVVFTILAVFSFLFSVFWTVLGYTEDVKLFKPLKFTIPIFAFSVIVLVFTPSQKDIMLMYGIPAIIDSEIVKDCPELYKLGKTFLEKELKK